MRIKRRNGLVSALLGLVTCGLYHIFFWYQYGEDTNWVCRDDRKMTQNYIVAWILSWMWQLQDLYFISFFSGADIFLWRWRGDFS